MVGIKLMLWFFLILIVIVVKYFILFSIVIDSVLFEVLKVKIFII